MKKKYIKTTLFYSSFIIVAIFFYFLHFAIFKDAKHIFKYFVHDVAFLPIEVLLVTVVLHRLLEKREKKHRLQKLNMVIGSFFSESGLYLLEILSNADDGIEKVRKNLIINSQATAETFKNVKNTLCNYKPKINISKINLIDLQKYLKNKRTFFLSLLQNPNLLEHETFTDVLMAVFHLTEELAHRHELNKISEKDKEHLEFDIKRAYNQLIKEWIFYMKHLNEEFPYLYSFALRTNPFDKNKKIEF